MIIDMNYWTKVFRKLLILSFPILGLYFAFKLSIFYMPFLIAFIIAQIIEPIIRFFMRNFKLKRRVSAIIVFLVIIILIIGILVAGISSLISESSNLLNGLNGYVEIISEHFNLLTSKLDLSKLNLSNDIIETIQNSGKDILDLLAEWIKNFLNSILNIITSLPSIGIYTAICVLALFFICTDKIYMIDQLEHHLPKKWVKKLSKHLKEISKSLGSYLKAQLILALITFIICLIGLYIIKFTGISIKYPLLSAIGIGFVDALPIFGASAAIIPWAIISSLNGNFTLGISLVILLAIISITKQLLEPKIVSKQIGIHPIFTLIAMYTGFKLIGILGTLLGPIILIILKEVFSNTIDKGLAKSIFEREI